MKKVDFPNRLGGQNFEAWAESCFRQIEDASREDALDIADGFRLANAPLPSITTFDPSTATPAQTAQVLASLIDLFQRRGPNRVE